MAMRGLFFPLVVFLCASAARADTLIDSKSFNYSGLETSYTVPAGTDYLVVKAWGAGGGDGVFTRGGGGAFVYVAGAVTPGQRMAVLVGGAGQGVMTGGWPGGGSAGGLGGAGGGAYSRVVSAGFDVIAAGGGGGGNSFGQGGAGGGPNGGNAGGPGATGGQGGTINNGGAGGTGDLANGQAGVNFQGGNSSPGGYVGGGGGGGINGGGAGANTSAAGGGGGGGGASYVAGVTTSAFYMGAGYQPGGISDPDYPGNLIGYGGLDDAAYNPGHNGYILVQAWVKSGPPAFPSSLPDQTLNQRQPADYQIPVQAQPGLTSFVATGLPAGLVASNPDGIISGLAPNGTSNAVTATYIAKNAVGEARATQKWTIVPAVLIPSLTYSNNAPHMGDSVVISATGTSNFGMWRIEATMWPPNSDPPFVLGHQYAPSFGQKTFSVSWPPYTFLLPGRYEVQLRVVDIYENGADVPATLHFPVDVNASNQPIPYATGFDSYGLGKLTGDAWVVWQGMANVVAPGDPTWPGPTPQTGTRSLRVEATNPFGRIFKTFSSAAPETFIDIYARPFAGTAIFNPSIIDYATAQVAYFKTGANQATLHVYSGNGAGGGAWVPTAATIATDASGLGTNWTRITVDMNYTNHTWAVLQDGSLIRSGIPMMSNTVNSFSALVLWGSLIGPSHYDTLNIQNTNPFTISTPSGLTLGGATYRSITATWPPVTSSGSGVSYYLVSINGGSPVQNATNTITVNGLIEDTAYSIQVQAFNNAGVSSGWSPIVNLTTAKDNTLPSIPLNLTATLANYNAINLSWSASTDDYAMAGYLVYQNGVALNTVSSLVTGTTYNLTGLAENTVYSYSVKAVDASKAKNISGPSVTATKTTGLNPVGDYDGDGIANGVEDLLGTNSRSSTTTDSSNQVQLKINAAGK